jgi:hypothetical protein
MKIKESDGKLILKLMTLVLDFGIPRYEINTREFKPSDVKQDHMLTLQVFL